MKTNTFLALWLILLQACSSTQQENAAIPGMYVRQFHNEFGTGWDTVVIEPQSGVANGYVVTHHIQTIRKGDDQVATPMRKELVLPSTWNRNEKVLVTSRLGRKYTFPQKDTLMLGTARYKRI